MCKPNKCPACSREDTDSVPLRLMGAFMRLNRQRWLRCASEGMRQHEFQLLHFIHRFTREQPGGPRLSELSDRLGVTPPTVTQQINELERRGLVERLRDGADRRSVRVMLRAEGEALLARNHEAVLAFFSEVADRLGPERSATLATLLSEVAGYMEPTA